MQVRVYRNLHKNCYSIMARVANGWRVVAHAESVGLHGVTFKVSQAGRNRVLASGKKEVHAFACGELKAWRGTWASAGYEHMSEAAILNMFRTRNAYFSGGLPDGAEDFFPKYNPAKAATFVDGMGYAVTDCDSLRMSQSGLYAVNRDKRQSGED